MVRGGGSIELTVPFETLLEEAALRKTDKYAELVEYIRMAGYRCIQITIEFELHGLINLPKVSKLKYQFHLTKKITKERA